MARDQGLINSALVVSEAVADTRPLDRLVAKVTPGHEAVDAER
jgi:hypothetical protein